MRHYCFYDKNLKVVMGSVSGNLEFLGLKVFLSSLVKTCKKHSQSHVLLDIKAIEFESFSREDTLSICTETLLFYEVFSKRKCAFVIDTDAQYDFLTEVLDLGLNEAWLNTKLFRQIDIGLEWLYS